MEPKLKIAVSGTIAAVLLLCGFLAMRPDTIGQHGAAPAYGALSGPDISSPYLAWGNVRFWAAAPTVLTQNASTTCSMQSPASTSTLQAAQIRFDVSSSSALIVEIGKASDPYSTTTLLGTTYNIGANAQAFIQASTSPAAGAATVFAPNTYLNFKIGGGGTGSLPTGSCQAEWIQS